MASKKRAKTCNSTDTSPSESAVSVSMEDSSIKKLDEINSKLGLILNAIYDLTNAVKQKGMAGQTVEESSTVAAISKTMEELSSTIQRNVTENTSVYRSANIIEEEAMMTKTRIANVWERKVQQRKDAYWGKVRNEGYHTRHTKWINSTPMVIPRRLQKSEFRNENEDQKILRERATLQEYRNEIEMEKLRFESCMESVRRLDTEMEEIIYSKSTGKVAEFLIEMWKRTVKRNEEISHKRWKNNERWLNTYEEEFQSKYKDKSPFFKTRDDYQPERRNYDGRKNIPTYADVVRQGNNNIVNQQERHPRDIEGFLTKILQQLNSEQNYQQQHRPSRFQQNYSQQHQQQQRPPRFQHNPYHQKGRNNQYNNFNTPRQTPHRQYYNNVRNRTNNSNEYDSMDVAASDSFLSSSQAQTSPT